VTRETKTLQGAWTITSLEVDGHKIEGPSSAQVIVNGDRFSTQSMGAAYEGRLELDTAQSPKHFNLVFTEGPEKGNTNRGIYELSGDTWRICLNMAGGPRPTRFATTPGSGLALETLQRSATVQPAGKPDRAAKTELPAAPDGDPAPELAGEWSMASCVMDGRPLEAEYLPMGKRAASATEVTVTMGPQIMVRAGYRVDRAPSPPHMNYILWHGPHKGKLQRGLYRFEDGVLTTCMGRPDGDRPADFNTAAGDGRTLTVWHKK